MSVVPMAAAVAVAVRTLGLLMCSLLAATVLIYRSVQAVVMLLMVVIPGLEQQPALQQMSAPEEVRPVPKIQAAPAGQYK